MSGIVNNVVATITALEAQAAASLFLSDNLGDRFLASSPKLDSAAHVWRVPILLAYPSLVPWGRRERFCLTQRLRRSSGLLRSKK